MIDFSEIEHSKENIEPVAQGRSAKGLAKAFSTEAAPARQRRAAQRALYEEELAGADELDDPLDVWVRYVDWVHEAFPQGQSAESGLIPLLERCAQQFLESEHYANDPRYLRIWIEYSKYSDAPLEVFSFLHKHGIGARLATFYEQYAGLLETLKRKRHAEFMYRQGLELRARPQERLRRRYEEFQQRLRMDPPGPDDRVPGDVRRGILAARDVEHSTMRPIEQEHTPTTAARMASAGKVAVFTDDDAGDNDSRLPFSGGGAVKVGSGGWASVGNLQARRKENTVEARPWAGETMAQQKGVSGSGASKFAVFVDPNAQRTERQAADFDRVYPDCGGDFSLEELLGQSRGLLRGLQAYTQEAAANNMECLATEPPEHPAPAMESSETAVEMQIHDDNNSREAQAEVVSTAPEQPEEMMVKVNTTPVKDGNAVKSTGRASPTINTKAALADVFDLFNQPLKFERDSDNSDDDSEGDDTVTATVALAPVEAVEASSSSSDSSDEDDEDDEDDENDGADEDYSTMPSSTNDQVPDEKPFVFQDSPTKNLVLGNGLSEHREADQPVVAPTPETPEPEPHRDLNLARRPLAFSLMTPINESNESMPPSTVRRPLGSPIAESPVLHRGDSKDEASDIGYASDNASGADSPLQSSPFLEDVTPRGDMQIPPPVMQNISRTAGSRDDKPLIRDPVCNPFDDSIKVRLYDYYSKQWDYSQDIYDYTALTSQADAIERFAKAIATKKSSGELSGMTVEYDGDAYRHLSIRRKLGEGAYAAVYQVQAIRDDGAENTTMALKVERPASSWEFYVMRRAATSFHEARVLDSLIKAESIMLYADASFLVMDYCAQGTLLDVVNMAKADGAAGVDEVLVMFFTIELLRIVRGLHSQGILHGDLKADNCLLRLQAVPGDEWDPVYHAGGEEGWRYKGLTLIDFGRSVDLAFFDERTQFIADWEPTQQDCAELKEMRPWRYQIDYHGLACVIYTLLYGGYIETVSENLPGRRHYRLAHQLKRYWQQDLWQPLFDMLLNPTFYSRDACTSITKELGELQSQFEDYVQRHCLRGTGLKSMIRRLESFERRPGGH